MNISSNVSAGRRNAVFNVFPIGLISPYWMLRLVGGCKVGCFQENAIPRSPTLALRSCQDHIFEEKRENILESVTCPEPWVFKMLRPRSVGLRSRTGGL